MPGVPDPLEMEFFFAPPKIGSGKYKNRLALANNLHLWHRWNKTKVKTEFTEYLKEWVIAENDGVPYREAEIRFKIFNGSKRRIDSDAIAYPVAKWVLDIIVRQGWLVDDDKVKVVHEIPEYNKDMNVDKIRVGVKLTLFKPQKDET